MQLRFEADTTEPIEGQKSAKEEGKQLVARILSSTHFKNSPRLRELLTFLTREVFAGRGAELHEQLIGCSVFGRQPGYSSSEDNIVRVQVRQLRLKLDAYFLEEGAREPLVLSIPKGSYIPVFSTIDARKPVSSVGRVLLISGGALLVAAIVAVAFLAGEGSVRHQKTNPVFANLFDEAHQTYVVVADSSLEMMHTLTGRTLSLENYIRRDYALLYQGLSVDMRQAAGLIGSRQATSIVDSSVAAAVLRLTEERGPRVSIKYARDLQMRDLKMAHVVLLGSKRSNPWIQLFESVMNFSIEQEDGPFVQNRAPRPGEQELYRGRRSADGLEGYSIVAYLPNLSRTGNVVIIAGTGMNATEAAGEFITDPARASAFLRKITGQVSPTPVPYFEALLKTSSMAGVAKEATVVTHRLIQVSN